MTFDIQLHNHVVMDGMMDCGFWCCDFKRKNCHLQPIFGNKNYILQSKIYMQTTFFNCK